MDLLWDILPDWVDSITTGEKKGYDVIWNTEQHASYRCLIKINWHDKTEITRPIQEATEADKMKICCFWDYENDKRHYGVLTAIHGKFFELEGGPQYNHCRRLTKQEIEEIC